MRPEWVDIQSHIVAALSVVGMAFNLAPDGYVLIGVQPFDHGTQVGFLFSNQNNDAFAVRLKTKELTRAALIAAIAKRRGK